MSEGTLQFELVTPARLAYSAQVEMVEVPGELGDFGVLPGHAPFMSIIRAGVVSVHESADVVKRFFVPAGYAEVNPDGCTVLAEQIRDMADVTADEVAKELEQARQGIAQAKDEAEQMLAEKAMMAAQALQDALNQR